MEQTTATNFFSLLKGLGLDGVSIAILFEGEGMTVSVLPKSKGIKDDAVHEIKPLSMRGTATEMDMHFFETIEKPFRETVSFYATLEAFEEGQRKAKENSKIESEKKKQVEDYLSKIDKVKKDENYTDKDDEKILKYIAKIFEIEPGHKKAKELHKEIQGKAKTLF